MDRRRRDAGIEEGKAVRRCLTIVRGIAVIGCATLAACQTFSQDGGMSVTADIAGKTLNKNVVAIRSELVEVAARGEF
jgi:hypothetical protein